MEQPAAIFNLSLERGRFSFEPGFTFSLEEGRDWYQVYWLRYKVLQEGKFKLRTGGHLGLNFARILDAGAQEVIKAERYLVAELAPTYELSEKSKVGMQYMIAQGYDIGTSQLQYFLPLNAGFSNIKLSKTLFLDVSPQVYYLSSFGFGDGSYAASAFKFHKADFPLSLSALVNKTLSTNIPGKDFLWNLSMTYSFAKGIISKS